MNSVTHRSRLLSSTILVGVIAGVTAFAGAATAQQTQATPGADASTQEVVVTGSRIKRAADDTAAPVSYINAQDLSDRGYINPGQALNDVTFNAPSLPVVVGNGSAAGSGQTYPNLFNLGAGRTLTLVDGQRFVTSTTGGDRIVDTNVIPIGLVDRIDVVEAGGQGESYGQLASLATGVERYSGTLLGHYDFNSHLRLSGSLLYANTKGEDPYGNQASNTVLNSAASGSGVITFTKNNPFLSASDVSSIAAVDPAFGAGAPAFLSKFWTDLLPSREATYSTDYYRGLIKLDGDFNAVGRNFYYSASYSRAEAKGDDQGWGVYNAHFNNAVNATTNGAGQIVCAINATTVTDPACAPLNPFGLGNVSPAARAYVSVPVGETYTNVQDDFLLSLGGDVIDLPAGKVKFSLGYEHRAESASYNPDEANQLGLVDSGVPTVATHGSYETNEYSGELLVPILGQGFNLPFARTVELSGQYRLVDNTLAGEENIWGLGARWEVFKGLTFRVSRSRNFRAPTLDQLLAPSSTALGSLSGGDPCDFRYIGQGANPSARLASCQALFAAHPSWGALSTFQDPSSNFSNAEITTGGNPNLQNEISNTTTFGVVYHPDWVPGQLNLTLDRIQIDLKDGITALLPYQFADACTDGGTGGNAACSTFTRDPATGYITAAQSTTFNAQSVQYHGETLNIDYRFPARWLVGRDLGSLELQLSTTHNEALRTNIVGAVTQIAGTTAEPRWVGRFDIRYAVGPLRMTYEAYYLPSAYAAQGATALNTAIPVISSNLRQNISAAYDFGHYTFRAGINNIANQGPSWPTLNYGDIIGREFFVGVKARY